MKNTVLMLALAMFSFAAGAQKVKEAEVPAAVKSAFQKLHPDISKVKWEKEKQAYEAEFRVNNRECSELFDATGNLVESEMEIVSSALPAAVKDYISKNYKGKKIKEAEKITNARGTVNYEAVIKGKELRFDEQGNFLREETD